MATQVQIHGLGELQRGLREVEKGLPREVAHTLEATAERSVLPAARSAAPVLSGALRGSLEVKATNTRVGIRSALPYANAVHWGWKAHNIRSNPFVYLAMEGRMEEFAEQLSAALDGFFRSHGLH